MSSSILTDTKKLLGQSETDTAFDTDILIHLNSTFGELNQLGIGPPNGFVVLDKNATWAQLLGDEKRYEMVKSHIYLRVRMLFDPPELGYVLDAWQKVLEESAWRISAMRNEIDHPVAEDERELRDDLWGDPVRIDGGDLDG